MRARTTLVFAAALALASAPGCTQILGGDADYQLTSGGAGGTVTTSAGGAGGSSTIATTTSEGGGGGTSTTATTTSEGGGGTGGTATTTTTTTSTTTGNPCEEADLQTSPEHCGACDHGCLGGECAGGVCQPVVIATGLVWIQDIAIDATHVYWLTAGDGRVERAPIAGGPREIIVEGRTDARALLVDPDHVYFTDPPAKKIFRAAKEAGAVAAPFVPNVTSPRRLARTGQEIVGTHGAVGTVTRWPVMIGPAIELISGLVSPTVITTDATSVYFVDVLPGIGDDVLFRMPLDGSNEPVALAADLHEPRALVHDGTFAYVADAAGLVARVSAAGNVQTISSGADDATGVSVDGEHVYWTQLDAGDGSLHRAAKDGAGAVTLASGLVTPGSVVTNDQAVCWMDVGPMAGGLFEQGKIYLLAK